MSRRFSAQVVSLSVRNLGRFQKYEELDRWLHFQRRSLIHSLPCPYLCDVQTCISAVKVCFGHNAVIMRLNRFWDVSAIRVTELSSTAWQRLDWRWLALRHGKPQKITMPQCICQFTVWTMLLRALDNGRCTAQVNRIPEWSWIVSCRSCMNNFYFAGENKFNMHCPHRLVCIILKYRDCNSAIEFSMEGSLQLGLGSSIGENLSRVWMHNK